MFSYLLIIQRVFKRRKHFWSIANFDWENECKHNFKPKMQAEFPWIVFLYSLIVTFLALVLLHKKTIWYFTSRNGNTGTKSRLNDHSTQRNSFILILLECKVQINIYITSIMYVCHHWIVRTTQLFEAMFILLAEWPIKVRDMIWYLYHKPQWICVNRISCVKSLQMSVSVSKLVFFLFQSFVKKSDIIPYYSLSR